MYAGGAFSTPNMSVLHLPSFDKTDLATPNSIISGTVNRGCFDFVVYVGVMTKEIQIYCGLDKYTGAVYDLSLLIELKSFFMGAYEDVEERFRDIEKLGKVSAIIYADAFYKRHPTGIDDFHVVSKNVLEENQELTEKLSTLVKI